MGQVGSSLEEFHVNSGSGRVGSLHLWVESGRVKKTGPTSNFVSDPTTQSVSKEREGGTGMEAVEMEKFALGVGVGAALSLPHVLLQ